jgi:outer membrane protein TolC
MCGTSGRAQQSLSLDSAVNAAVTANPDIKIARASVQEAAERATQTRAAFFPKIDFTQSWQRGNQPVFVFGSLLAQRQFAEADFALRHLNHPEAVTNSRSALSLDYVVFDGGRTRAAVRAGSLETAMARALERQTQSDLVVATTRAYGRVVRAAAERSATDEAVAAAAEDVRVAEARRDAGTASDAELLSMQTHLADMRSRAIDAAGETRIARAELNRLMNRPLSDEQPLEAIAPIPVSVSDTTQLIERATTERPESTQAALRVDLSETARTRARGAFLPEVAVQGAYEWNDGQRGSPASAWITGVAVRVNLFAGGASGAQMREAAHATERARAERERTVAAIQVEVVAAIEQVRAARARESVGRAAAAQARESQRIIRDRFEAGLAQAGDVIRAATAVLDAEAQRVRAAVDIMVGEAALRRAVGEQEVNR